MSTKLGHLIFILSSLGLFTACDSEREVLAAKINASSVIIGEDSRSLVTGQYNKDNRTVGQLIAQSVSGNTVKIHRCSATAINGNYVITAAHCLFNDSAALKDMYFYPAIREHNTQPFGRFPVLQIYYPKLYQKDSSTVSNTGFDIAVIKVGVNEAGDGLSRYVGGRGWWGVKNLPSNRASTLGYPGDKPTSKLFQEQQCYLGPYQNSSFLFETHCDVYSGQSGSPVFIRHEETDENYIVGVIAAELSHTNLVTRITQERQKIINAIVDGTYSAKKSEFLEQWNIERMPKTEGFNILVKNTCSDTMNVAYYAISAQDKQWKTYGFIQVRPGQTMQITNTPNGVYQLHAHNDRTRKHTLGDNMMKQVPGSSGHYFFTMYAPGKSGDTTYTITKCGNY